MSATEWRAPSNEDTMINYNVDSDGIATITWDMPGRTMNVLNEASLTAYTGALDNVSRMTRSRASS